MPTDKSDIFSEVLKVVRVGLARVFCIANIFDHPNVKNDIKTKENFQL